METKEPENKENNPEEDFPFHHFLRRMMLASAGILSYSFEEMEKFIDKMVERGEVVHKDHEDQFNEMREKRVRFIHDRRGFAHKRREKALDEFEVPTKKDIHEIDTRISDLEKKIDELKKSPDK